MSAVTAAFFFLSGAPWGTLFGLIIATPKL